MIRYLRRLLAAAATALVLPASASSTFTPDYTDLWILPAEAGWGVNVIQHYDTMFVTLFVYGSDNTPRWYHGSAVRTVGASQSQFSGTLYATVGSAFTAPWNPSALALTSVGTISFNFTSPTVGTLTYNVTPNPTVTKNIVRHTLAVNVMTGIYTGGLSASGTDCRSGIQNGPILIDGELSINHSSTTPTFRIDYGTNFASNCTFRGTYAQEGRFGSVTGGTWSCSIPGVSNPPAGTFTMSQLEATMNGITGRFSGSDQNCTYNGYFGGIKKVL